MAMPWKKMAAAFGRAVEDPAASKAGRQRVFESKTVKERPGDVQAHPQDTPEQRSFKGGMYQGDEAWELTYDQREIPDEARRIWENYDFDMERSYGPNGAYQEALRRARLDDNDYLPQSPEEFKERYGFKVDGTMPKRKPGYRKAWEREAEGYSDQQLNTDMNTRINREAESIASDKFREDAKDAELSDEFDDELLGQEREDEVIRIGEEIVNELKKRGSTEDFDDIMESIRMRYKK